MTIRYLIISIVFIAVSFFIGYSINPYNQVFEAAAILDRISMIMSDDSFTITYHGDYFKADKVIPRDSVMENFVEKKNNEIKKSKVNKQIDITNPNQEYVVYTQREGDSIVVKDNWNSSVYDSVFKYWNRCDSIELLQIKALGTPKYLTLKKEWDDNHKKWVQAIKNLP